ncbi:MAG TPA: EAL domain-containing protein [Gammaproteobacteria bacterium]|nr:EAL domain-containing protein [Gammaproteobacteria bacterium]
MQWMLYNQSLTRIVTAIGGWVLLPLIIAVLLAISYHYAILVQFQIPYFILLLGLIVYIAQYAHKQKKQLQHLSSLSQATLESIGDGILITNDKGKIIKFNNNLLQILAIEKDKAISSHLVSQLDSLVPHLFSKNIQELKNSAEIISTDLYCKNGKILRYQSYPQCVNRRIIGRVFSFHDITHNKLAEQQLLYYATHDALTGLANRLHLMSHIKNALSQAKSKKHLAAILFFDLNRFKIINDSLGHVMGDGLLRSIAERLQKHTKAQDLLARLGGDEFVLSVSHITAQAEAITIAQRYLSELSKPFQLAKHNLYMHCSIGISIYPYHGTTAAVLMKNADLAMYAAKKNHFSWQFYSKHMQQEVFAQLSIESSLIKALEKREFVIHYQPIIDLRSKTISGFEALIRWQHPKKGLLLPSKFITLAENIGIIAEISEWILDTVATQALEWQQQNLFNGRISINLSSKQCQSPVLCEKIMNKLKSGQLNAHYLELELTENTFTENFSYAADALYQLQNLGVSISLDDFGTGYSNLEHLKNLPLNKLKIDRSFITHLPENVIDKTIVLNIISLAKSLNLRTLAEGVENQAQLDFLREHGCDEIQGFYFSEPLCAEDYVKNFFKIKRKIDHC